MIRRVHVALPLLCLIAFNMSAWFVGECAAEEGLGVSNTLSLFFPKSGPEGWLWVYAQKGRYFLELPPQNMLLESFLSVSGNSQYRESGLHVLKKAESTELFGYIPEQVGDRYSVIFPQIGKTYTFSIESLAVDSSSPQGPRLVGILVPIGELPQNMSALSGVCGLGVKSSGRVPPEVCRVPPSVPHSEIEDALNFARSTPQGGGAILEKIEYIYLSYPGRKAYLLVLGDGSRKWLAVIERTSRGLSTVPFMELGSADPVDMHDIEEGPVGSCFDSRVNEIYVLPDLSGNGSNEILVRGTVWSVLDGQLRDPFDETKGYLFVKVKEGYWGP